MVRVGEAPGLSARLVARVKGFLRSQKRVGLDIGKMRPVTEDIRGSMMLGSVGKVPLPRGRERTPAQRMQGSLPLGLGKLTVQRGSAEKPVCQSVENGTTYPDKSAKYIAYFEDGQFKGELADYMRKYNPAPIIEPTPLEAAMARRLNS